MARFFGQQGTQQRFCFWAALSPVPGGDSSCALHLPIIHLVPPIDIDCNRGRVSHLPRMRAYARKIRPNREKIMRSIFNFILRKLKIHSLETNLTLRRTECQTLARQFDLPESTPEQDAYIKLRWANAMEETRALQLKLQSLVSGN
jgi:hypothetical protein